MGGGPKERPRNQCRGPGELQTRAQAPTFCACSGPRRGALPALEAMALPPALTSAGPAHQGSCMLPPSASVRPTPSRAASLLNRLPQCCPSPRRRQATLAGLARVLSCSWGFVHTLKALKVQMCYLVDGTQKELSQNRKPWLGSQPHCVTLGKPLALSELRFSSGKWGRK